MKKIYVNEAKTAQIVLESSSGQYWYVKNQPTKTGLPCAASESDEPFMTMQMSGIALRTFIHNGEAFSAID